MLKAKKFTTTNVDALNLTFSYTLQLLLSLKLLWWWWCRRGGCDGGSIWFGVVGLVAWREGEETKKRKTEKKIEKKIINEWIGFNFVVKIRVLMWSELWNDKLK